MSSNGCFTPMYSDHFWTLIFTQIITCFLTHEWFIHVHADVEPALTEEADSFVDADMT